MKKLISLRIRVLVMSMVRMVLSMLANGINFAVRLILVLMYVSASLLLFFLLSAWVILSPLILTWSMILFIHLLHLPWSVFLELWMSLFQKWVT